MYMCVGGVYALLCMWNGGHLYTEFFHLCMGSWIEISAPND